MSAENEINWNALLRKVSLERDADAFKQIFKFFYDDLHYFGRAILHDPTLAEDIVNDIMLSIWQDQGQYLKIQNLKTYLFRAVKNKALNLHAHQLVKATYLKAYDYQQAQPSPEEQYISREIHDNLNKLIDTLPPKTKMAFVLVKDNACSYKEAAAIMEVSTNTIDRHIQIALQRLKQHFYKK